MLGKVIFASPVSSLSRTNYHLKRLGATLVFKAEDYFDEYHPDYYDLTFSLSDYHQALIDLERTGEAKIMVADNMSITFIRAKDQTITFCATESHRSFSIPALDLSQLTKGL